MRRLPRLVLNSSINHCLISQHCSLNLRRPTVPISGALHNQTRCLGIFPNSKRREPETFDEFIEQIDEDKKAYNRARGLVAGKGNKFNKLLKIPDRDTTDEDTKMEIMLSAIALYKEKEPRVRTDHVEFVQWCIKRIWEFHLEHRVEIYEELITVFPSYKYTAPSWVEKLTPKPQPGLYTIIQLINMASGSRVKPSYTMYRNIYRVFGKSHPVCALMRQYGWWHHVMKKCNPYPIDGGYEFENFKSDHRKLAKYVAERTMDQDVKYEDITTLEGEYIGTSCLSQTQEDLSSLQVIDDIMRMSGPHSIWCGRVQRWYWVLRREERGDEFEGAPLGITVSPYKDKSLEAAQLFLKNMQKTYIGIAGSTVLFEEPTEVLMLNPSEHFESRKKFYGYEDTRDAVSAKDVSTITEPQYEEVLEREKQKKKSRTFIKKGAKEEEDNEDDDW